MELRRILLGLFAAILLSFSFLVSAASSSQVVRENDVVLVQGAQEHWVLVWEHPPSKICVPRKDTETGWYACTCAGFAYGEAGIIDLIRKRSGQVDEILPLTPLFASAENPANEEESAEAVIQKWPFLESDIKWSMEALPNDYMKQIMERKIVRIMKFADYNHDGQASEFPLEVGAGPCGHTASVLIGVSKAVPKLHVFATVTHPDQPLVLESSIWDDLLNSKGDVTSIEFSCGDHGSEEQQEVHLVANSSGIHAERLIYQCTDNFERGKLISRKPF